MLQKVRFLWRKIIYHKISQYEFPKYSDTLGINEHEVNPFVVKGTCFWKMSVNKLKWKLYKTISTRISNRKYHSVYKHKIILLGCGFFGSVGWLITILFSFGMDHILLSYFKNFYFSIS